MFGEVNFHLSWVYAFNNEIDCLHSDLNPPADPNMKKVGILLDASGSMRDLQNPVKLVLSAAKCMSNTQGRFNAPTPNGGTAIVDSVDTLWGMDKMEDLDQVLIVTDGEDTVSTAERILKCIDEATGDPVYTSLPTLISARAAAVAAHLDALGIDMTIVGVDTEVKGFIAECAKPGRGLRTALIARNATPEDVGAVMTSVTRRKPRQRSRKEADDTVVAGTATPISETEVTALRTEALRTSTHQERLSNPNLLIDGAPYAHVMQDAYMRHLIESEVRRLLPDKEDYVPLINVVEDIVVHFFSSLIRTQNQPVASAILQGPSWPSGKKLPSGEPDGKRVCALLYPHPLFGDLSPGRWTSMLGKLIEYLARNPGHIRERVAKHLPFTPELDQAIEDNVVGPIYRHAGRPHTRIAISHGLVPHDDLRTRTLYFKFNETKATFDHFVMHHRDSRYTCPVANGLESPPTLPTLPTPPTSFLDTRIMEVGNSSAKAYGGPACPPPEEPPPPSPKATAAARGDDDSDLDERAPLSHKKQRKQRAPVVPGEWGCSRCRFNEKGCKAKRCRPKPGARPKRSSEAASPSREADGAGSSSEADSAAGAAMDDDDNDSSTHSAGRTNANSDAGATDALDLKRLKRKISALEDENLQLKAKLAAVAVVVKSN